MPQLPSDWDSLRKRRLKRDNHRCSNCSAKGGPSGDAELHVHHIVPRKDGGSDNIENLQTLCEDCHDAIHHKNKKAPTADEKPENSWFEDLAPQQQVVGRLTTSMATGGFILVLLLGLFTPLDGTILPILSLLTIVAPLLLWATVKEIDPGELEEGYTLGELVIGNIIPSRHPSADSNKMQEDTEQNWKTTSGTHFNYKEKGRRSRGLLIEITDGEKEGEFFIREDSVVAASPRLKRKNGEDWVESARAYLKEVSNGISP